MAVSEYRLPNQTSLRTTMRWSSEERIFRVCRLIWANRIGPGQPGGHCTMVSLSLQPRLFQWRHYEADAEVTLFGIRLHYLRNYDRWIT